MIDSIVPIPAFSDNYIWTLIDSDRCSAAVVDPGDAKSVIRFLDERGLKLDSILITHHHPDHTGGLPELGGHYQPEVYGPRNGRIRGVTRTLNEADTLSVLGVDFAVIEVPGHTLDHIAFFASTENPPILFCGDTLFAAGCGRLFEGTPAMMHQSLSKLAALPGATRVYCAHEYTLANLKFARAVEPDSTRLAERLAVDSKLRQDGRPTLPSTIALELQTNPFLRCSEPQLRTAAEARSGGACDTATEVFSAIRRWKDEF